jgi:hypothetical protein
MTKPRIVIQQHCGIRNRAVFRQGEVIYQHPEGTLDHFLDGIFTKFVTGYPKFHKMDHLSKIGFLGADILLKEGNLLQQYAPEQVALVLSNAHASLDTDIRYLESTKTGASPSLFVYTLPNIVAGEISIRHGLKGETAFFIFPAFDPVQMAGYVSQVMATEKTQACVAGWVDVIGEHHNVFLYLAEKRGNSNAVEHTPEQLQKLYDGNDRKPHDRSKNADH